MIDCLTDGIDTTSAYTRISAFLRETGFVAWTIFVDDTLRINTHCNTVSNLAFTIVRAGRRTARISFWKKINSSEYTNTNTTALELIFWCILFNLPTGSVHSTNGLPINGDGQLQSGLWFIALQVALMPQTFWVQGFTHLLLMHALSPGQSELITHSGWQPVMLEGIPWRPGRHLHTTVSPTFSQRVFGPQGDGEQGSLSFGSEYRKQVYASVEKLFAMDSRWDLQVLWLYLRLYRVWTHPL